MSKPFGIPHTGVFGLFDLTGIDLIPYVGASLRELLPQGDACRQAYRDLPLITDMIASGYTGRKGKGGFYRLTRDGGRKTMEAIDLATGAYRAAQPADLPELADGGADLRALPAGTSAAARYAWRVISHTLAYAARHVPETTDEITAIDAAMCLGYNWSWGPFELADRIGIDWLIDRLTPTTLQYHNLCSSPPDPASTASRPVRGRRWGRMASITRSAAPGVCCCWKISGPPAPGCCATPAPRCEISVMASPVWNSPAKATRSMPPASP
jgi:3-hydroxyacyl-CoA dehydrogenase